MNKQKQERVDYFLFFFFSFLSKEKKGECGSINKPICDSTWRSCGIYCTKTCFHYFVSLFPSSINLVSMRNEIFLWNSWIKRNLNFRAVFRGMTLNHAKLFEKGIVLHKFLAKIGVSLEQKFLAVALMLLRLGREILGARGMCGRSEGRQQELVLNMLIFFFFHFLLHVNWFSVVNIIIGKRTKTFYFFKKLGKN